MADRWGCRVEGGARRRTPPRLSLSLTAQNADTVQPGERSPYGCDFLSSPPFFSFSLSLSLSFFFSSSCFYSSKEGPTPPLHHHHHHHPPPPTCLPVSAFVWGRGSSVIIFEGLCKRVCESATLRTSRSGPASALMFCVSWASPVFKMPV